MAPKSHCFRPIYGVEAAEKILEVSLLKDLHVSSLCIRYFQFFERFSVKILMGPCSLSTADGPYQPFKEGTQDIRLITIIPVQDDAAARSQIRCRLDLVSLSGQFHSPAYQKYLKNASAYNETGEFIKVPAAGQECKQQELEEWIEVSASGDDATTSLPEFRYTWGDYMALSYTWGDPSLTREILLNGNSLRVTANVEACLRVLRAKAYIKRG